MHAMLHGTYQVQWFVLHFLSKRHLNLTVHRSVLECDRVLIHDRSSNLSICDAAKASEGLHSVAAKLDIPRTFELDLAPTKLVP